MSFEIPNESAATHEEQATLFAADIAALVQGLNYEGVIEGCAVSEDSPASMDVAVASGTIRVGGVEVAVSAGDVTLATADGTRLRIDIVVVNNSGTKSKVDGTWDGSDNPIMAAIPANSVLLAAVALPASDTAIANAQITDKRVILGETADFHQVEIEETLAIGAALDATAVIKASRTLDGAVITGCAFVVTCSKTGGTTGKAVGASANVYYAGSATFGVIQGFLSTVYNNSSTGIYAMQGMVIELHSEASSARHASSLGTGVDLAGVWHATDGHPVTMRGIWIKSTFCPSASVTAYGLHIEDLSPTTTCRLLEIGPSTPYLRLLGGSDPAAGDTNLYLKVGGTLKQVYVVSDYLKVK